MRSFVRGGQTTIHSFRMVGQLFITLYFLSLIMVTGLILYFAWGSTSSMQRKIFVQYYVAKIDNYFLTPQDEGMAKNKYAQNNSILKNPHNIIAKNQILFLAKKSVKSAAFVTLITNILIIIFFILRGQILIREKFLRGGKITSSANLARLIKKYNKRRSYKAYKIAGLEFPAYTEHAHTLITGGSGTGKTNLISDLIEQIKQRQERAIIYDKMGSYISQFYDQNSDIILNPLDKRCPKWSLMRESRNITDCRNIAAAFVPKSNNAADPFWTEAARVVFAEVFNLVRQNNNSGNNKLIEYLLHTDIAKLSKLLKETPAHAIIDDRSMKTSLSIMSVLTANLQSLRFLKDTNDHIQDNYFSIRQWVENEKQNNILFISSRADQHETLKPLISAWLEIAINSLLSLEQNSKRKIWVILDELPSLHYLPSLADGLAQTRQFGGAFVLSLQLMAQLRQIYGRDNAETASGLCRNRVVFSTPDEDTAKWCADNLGKMELEEFREGQSYGAHQSRDGVNVHKDKHIRNLVLSSEILNLPNLSAYVKLGNNFPLAQIDIPYVMRPKIADKFIIREDIDTLFIPKIQVIDSKINLENIL